MQAIMALATRYTYLRVSLLGFLTYQAVGGCSGGWGDMTKGGGGAGLCLRIRCNAPGKIRYIHTMCII
jgi:hypothetical protein